MGIGMSQEECDNSCDREIRMYQKEEERCRFDKKELKSDSEKYKEEIDELTDKFNDFEFKAKGFKQSVETVASYVKVCSGAIKSNIDKITILPEKLTGTIKKLSKSYCFSVIIQNLYKED